MSFRPSAYVFMLVVSNITMYAVVATALHEMLHIVKVYVFNRLKVLNSVYSFTMRKRKLRKVILCIS